MAQRFSSSSSIITTIMDTTTTTSPPTAISASTDRKKSALMPSRKSVDFAILPPAPKRSRGASSFLMSCWTPKQVVDAISTSITDTERLQALEKATEIFHHDVPSVHNDELIAGADAVLTKALSFVIMMMTITTNIPTSSSTTAATGLRQYQQELALLLQALESVYRAESDLVGRSFQRIGLILVRFIQHIIDQELAWRANAIVVSDTDDGGDNDMEEDEVRYHGDSILRHATKLLGHFARVGDATEPLASFPGMLPTLIRLISSTNTAIEAPAGDIHIPWEARLSAVWILANLACHAKNMERMVDTDQLVPCLMEVASRPRNVNDSVESAMEKLRSKSIASRAILNLSWAATNKEKLIDRHGPPLIDLLCNLSLYRTDPLHRSQTVTEILVNTRRYAVGALRNLAAAPRKHKISFCQYQNGYLLDVLTDAALNDTDQAVKDRAFAAIHNLAVHDTAPLIIGRPALVLALKDVLMTTTTPANDSNTIIPTSIATMHHEQQPPHADGTPKEHASATLMVLERSITPSMDSYQNLRDLLDELRRGKDNNNQQQKQELVLIQKDAFIPASV